MKALHDLVVSGKVRYPGACTLRAWQLAELNRVAEKHGWNPSSAFRSNTRFCITTEEMELLAYCAFKGIGVLAFSPLRDGHLARPFGKETP